MFGLIETDDHDILWARIRHHRNKLLAECDWTQLADAQCDKTAWATYRQKLRDLPGQNSDPTKVVFPIQPA